MKFSESFMRNKCMCNGQINEIKTFENKAVYAAQQSDMQDIIFVVGTIYKLT
jgi:hypothetical protein